MKTAGFIGWRGMVGSVLMERMRAEKDFELKPVRVTVRQLEMHGATSDPGADGRARVTVTLTVTATAGFYVRALARDLGRALGTGAHLSGLRRTKSGHFDIARAVPLAEAERLGPDVAAYVISPAEALAHFPAVTLNDLGFKRATHGNACGPAHLAGRFVPVTSGDEKVRLLDPAGHLVALANSRGGELHPAVVIADR